MNSFLKCVNAASVEVTLRKVPSCNCKALVVENLHSSSFHLDIHYACGHFESKKAINAINLEVRMFLHGLERSKRNYQPYKLLLFVFQKNDLAGEEIIVTDIFQSVLSLIQNEEDHGLIALP